MSMTVIIVSVLTKSVAATENTGNSADSAQTAILTLSSYVKDAVSPEAAASAAINPTGAGSVCWGSTNVTSQEGVVTNGWPSGGDETQLNETTGVIFAHDFDMEFCGYASDVSASNAPNVYEIFVNTVKSATSPGCTANNYCPVDIWNYGSSYATNDYAPAWPHDVPTCTPPGSCGNLVASIGRVWCDQACQQLGIACSSINATTNSALSNGITSLPANYSTLCPSGYSGTPPLFNYYTDAGTSAPNWNWVNAYTNSSSMPPNVNTAAIATTCAAGSPANTTPAAACGPMDMYSPGDDLTLETIQCIVLNMTVLGPDNPSNTSAKSSSVQITNQVWLRDLSQ